MTAAYTPTEIMTVAAARALRNDDVCFVGIGAPSAACNLARLTHAPGITLIYESGTIDTKPDVLPLSIGDGELCETALTTVSVPEMFRYWLQGGRITVGFLGGAQIDRFANLNTTVVGDYDRPKVRLPGGGGAPEIAANCGQIFITMAMSQRAYVEQLDFITSLGHGTGPEQPRRPRPHHARADARRHRPLHHGAGPRELRADRRLAPPRRHPRGGAGAVRLDAEVRRGRRRDAAADGGGARHPARTAGAHGARPRRRRMSHDAREAYICDAVRTPIGRFGGALAQVRADDLAAIPIRALLARHDGLAEAVEEVILGCANQAGEDNRNVARMAALLAGLPDTVPGTTMNRLCASGMDAVGTAARAIRAGEMDVAIAGGVESMTRAPLVMGKAEVPPSSAAPGSRTRPSAGASSTR